MGERLVEGEHFTFVVLGKPAPGGSKSQVPSPHSPTGFAVRPSSKRTKPWMRLVEAVVKSEWGDFPPIDAPVAIEAVFYYACPKRAHPDDWPLKTGNDLDKLERSTFDPLGPNRKSGWTGVIVSDRRIVKISSERRFGLPERAEVTVIRLPLRRVEAEDPQLALAAI